MATNKTNTKKKDEEQKKKIKETLESGKKKVWTGLPEAAKTNPNATTTFTSSGTKTNTAGTAGKKQPSNTGNKYTNFSDPISKVGAQQHIDKVTKMLAMYGYGASGSTEDKDLGSWFGRASDSTNKKLNKKEAEAFNRKQMKYRDMGLLDEAGNLAMTSKGELQLKLNANAKNLSAAQSKVDEIKKKMNPEGGWEQDFSGITKLYSGEDTEELQKKIDNASRRASMPTTAEERIALEKQRNQDREAWIRSDRKYGDQFDNSKYKTQQELAQEELAGLQGQLDEIYAGKLPRVREWALEKNESPTSVNTWYRGEEARREAYNAANGEDAYEERTAGMSQAEKKALDAEIDKALALVTPPEALYANDLEKANRTLAYYNLEKSQIDRYLKGYEEKESLDKWYNMPEEKRNLITELNDLNSRMAFAEQDGRTDTDEYKNMKDQRVRINYRLSQINGGQYIPNTQTDSSDHPEYDRGHDSEEDIITGNYDNSVHGVYSYLIGGKNAEAYNDDMAVAPVYRYASMMSEKEKKKFKELYNAHPDDPREAEAYLDGLEPFLQQRYNQFDELYARQAATQFPISSFIAGRVATAAEKVSAPYNILDAAFNQGRNAKNPYSTLNRITGAKQTMDAQLVQNAGGQKSFGEILVGAAQSVGDNIVNAVMAAGTGATGKALTAATHLMFGSSVFQDSLVSNLKETGDFENSLLHAVLDTALESTWEIASIEALLGEPTGLKYFLKNVAAEMSEEFNGAVVDPFVENFLTGTSEINKKINEYFTQGYYIGDDGEKVILSKDEDKRLEEAKRKAYRDWNDEIFLKSVGGGLGGAGSAGTMKGIQDAAGTWFYGKGIKNATDNTNSETFDSVLNMGLGMKDGSLAKEKAQKIAAKKKKGKNPSNYAVGDMVKTLYSEIGADYQKTVAETMVNALKGQLKAAGVTMDKVGSLAESVFRMIAGTNTKEDFNNLATNAVAMDVLKSYWTMDEKGKAIEDEVLAKTVDQRSILQIIEDMSGAGKASAVSRIVGEAVKTAKGSTDEAIDNLQATRPEIISEEFAAAAKEGLKGNKTNAKNQRYLDDAMKIRMRALTMGEMPVTSLDAETAKALWDVSKAELEKYDAERTKNSQPMAEPGKGTATFEGIEYGSDAWKAATRKLNKKTRNQMGAMGEIAVRAGLNVEFINDEKRPDIYGMEDNATGKVTINIAGKNADGSSHHILTTASHEFTHWIEQHSPEAYRNLRKFALDRMRANGVDVDALAIRKMDNFAYVMNKKSNTAEAEEGAEAEDKEQKPQTLDINGAVAEIVADACDQILGDEKVAKELAGVDPSLFDKAKQFVKDFVARIRNAVSGMNLSASYEAQTLMKDVDQLADLWLKGYKEATGRAAEGTAAGIEATGEGAAASAAAGGTSFSFQQKYEGDSLYKDAHVYDYDFLKSLPDIEVTKEGVLGDVVTDGELDREKITNIAYKRAIEEADGVQVGDHVVVKNAYTGRNIVLTGKGINHSTFTDRYQYNNANARAAQAAGLIAKRGLPINSLKNEGNAKGTYALAAPLIGSEKNIRKVAIMTVEVRSGNLVDVEVYDQTHSVSARKKNEAGEIEADASARNSAAEQRPPVTRSTMTISEFLDEVNSTHRSILSTDVLKHYEEEKPANGYWAGKTLFSVANKDTTDLDAEHGVITDSNGVELAGKFADDSVAKYSLASWDDVQRAKVKRALMKNGNFSEKQIDKWIDSLNGIAAMIAEDRGRLDFVANSSQKMLKKNQECRYTVDASTLCAKRLLYQGTFNAVQHLLPNTPLLPEDLVELANMMRDEGYETPCGICYVESRRRNLDKFAADWLENYNGNYIPTLDEVSTSDGLESLRTSDDKAKRQAHKDFIDAMNKKDVMNPKVVQLRTDYHGEIRDMRPGTVTSLNNHGGLRVQSFSDFETPHLLDMMQVVMDMAAKGLTSQAYTKVPNFAWVFGDTGMKINLSLIGKGRGVDADGNLIFDDVEGMPFAEAMKLRDRYSKNVGTILVGMNDEHILAAMADDRIDYIIPFHRSGWSNAELERMPVLNSYDDYTDYQNEKKIRGRKEDGSGYLTYSAKTVSVRNFEPVGQRKANGTGHDGYWDFRKSGKENAEAYLKMCAKDGRLPKFYQFLVDNGDGSFSLQPDGSTDGYWKLLIDFKMYDNNGKGSPQTVVKPKFNMEEARRVLNEYTLDRNGITRKDNNDLPVAEDVVKKYVEKYKKEHPLGEGRTQYSVAQMDREYMKAVKAGDEFEQQIWVNTRAEEMGYTTPKLYHGTRAFGFTEFDLKMGEGLIFATADRRLAETYSGYTDVSRITERTTIDVDNLRGEELLALAKTYLDKYDGYELATPEFREKEITDLRKIIKEEISILEKSRAKYEGSFDEEKERIFRKSMSAITSALTKVSDATTDNELTEAWDEYEKELWNFKWIDEYLEEEIFDSDLTSSIARNKRELYDLLYDGDIYLKGDEYSYWRVFDNQLIIELGAELHKGVYEMYGKPGKQLVIEADGINWNQITPPDELGLYGPQRTRDIAAAAKLHGYDSVLIRDLRDSGGETDFNRPSDVYIFFKADQVKSSDPITYDDEGNVIHLYDRFKPAEKDIRYSVANVVDMDVNRWMLGLNEESLATEQERNLLKQFKDSRMNVDIARYAVNEQKAKIRKLETKANPTAYDRAELIKARNILDIYERKLARAEQALVKITSSEGYAGMMYKQQHLMRDLISGRSAEDVRQTTEAIGKKVREVSREIDERAAELDEMAKREEIIRAKGVLAGSGLKQAAADLKKQMNSSMQNQEIENRLALITLKERANEDFTADLSELAQRLIETSGSGYESYILSELRGRTFRLSKSQMEELRGQHRTLKEIAQELKGTGIWFLDGSNGKGGTLDMEWGELCDAIPALDREATDKDMLNNLLDVIRGERNAQRMTDIDQADVEVMAFEKVMEIVPGIGKGQISRNEYNQLLEYIRKMSGEAKEAAEALKAMQAKIAELKKAAGSADAAAAKLDNNIGDAIRYFNKLTKQSEAVIWRRERTLLIEQMKNEKTEALIKEQEKWKAKIEKDKALREETNKLAHRANQVHTVLKRVRKRLMEETDKQNIPEHMKPLARKMLELVVHNDLTGRMRISAWDGRELDRINKWLEASRKTDGDFDSNELLEYFGKDEDAVMAAVEALRNIEVGIEQANNAVSFKAAERLAQKQEAVETIQKGVATIMSMINAQQQIDLNGRMIMIEDAAGDAIFDMNESKWKGEYGGRVGKAVGKAREFVILKNLTPVYFFKNLRNNTFGGLFKGIEKGENGSGLEFKRAQDTLGKLAEETGWATWDREKKHAVTFRGKTANITLEQMMALYATWKREKASADGPVQTQHLLLGGVVFNETDMDSGVFKRVRPENKPYIVTDEDMKNLETMLTEEQRKWVDGLVGYMSGQLADLGNDASMKMFGVKKYKENYYFPYKTWNGNLAKTSDVGQGKSDTRAISQSFTKRITQNARSTLEIGDFTQTAVDHIVGMIRYAEVGPANEYMRRVLNFKMTNPENGTKRNVESYFQSAYGTAAVKYLEQFQTDMNGGVALSKDKSLQEKLLSTFRKSAVAGSLSVTLQQPLSYIRAAMELSPRDMAAAGKYWKNSYKERSKYSGVSVIKDMGRFDMGMGESAKDFITPDHKEGMLKTAYGKVAKYTTILPEWADAVTWNTMWGAVKAEQHRLNPEMDMESDAFLEKVAERFNEIMRKTQVYDSVLVRSQNMRSQNPLMKMATSFMAEPTLSFNVLYDAVANIDQKGGKAKLAMAGATFAASAVLQSIVKAFLGALRSPDKKKNAEENFTYKFLYNVMNEMNPANLLPYYSDIVELLKKGELKDDAMGVIGKFKDIKDTVSDMINGKGKGWWRDLEDSAGQLVQLFTNVPVKNLMRDMRAMRNAIMNDVFANRPTSGAVMKYQAIDTVANADNLMGLINDWLGEAGYVSTTKAYQKRLYDAKKAGETGKAEELQEYLLKVKMTGDNAEKTLKSELNQMAKSDKDIDEEERLALLKENGYSKVGSYIMEQYQDGKLTRAEAEKLYRQEKPKASEKEILEAFDKVDYENETGEEAGSNFSGYTRLYKAIEENKAEAITGAVNRMKKAGYTDEQIQNQLKKKYTEQYAGMKNGSAEKVKLKDGLAKALKATGMSAELAVQTVTQTWQESGEKSIAKDASDDVMTQYLNGKITRQKAIQELKKVNPSATENDIWYELDRADFQKETGVDPGGQTYYRLYYAVQNRDNRNLAKIVNDMVQHGVKKSNIANTLMKKFGQELMSLSGNEQVKLRNSLEQAMKAAGQSNPNNYINKWIKKNK